jgi:hypothetical protein
MTERTEKVILAGGCFWGLLDLIRKRTGVLSTRVGYTGGDVANATYRHHRTHGEAIEITFDPDKTSYRELLEFFFQIHDPRRSIVRGMTWVRATAGHLLPRRRATARGRGHHRRCGGHRALARQGGHSGRAGGTFLGGRA